MLFVTFMGLFILAAGIKATRMIKDKLDNKRGNI